ncbi:MAG: hypothetical protein WC027_00905 [Candidatus Paceibacterota bacterium]
MKIFLLVLVLVLNIGCVTTGKKEEKSGELNLGTFRIWGEAEIGLETSN